jgi:hypothetical protein
LWEKRKNKSAHPEQFLRPVPPSNVRCHCLSVLDRCVKIALPASRCAYT